jgi:hypothetical protein
MAIFGGDEYAAIKSDYDAVSRGTFAQSYFPKAMCFCAQRCDVSGYGARGDAWRGVRGFLYSAKTLIVARRVQDLAFS